MINLSVFVSGAAVFIVAGYAEPAPDPQPRIEQVRMVCDQYCTCWTTRYQERQATPSVREDLVCRTPQLDRFSNYNGYYRQGPATGLGFGSRYPVREFAFPF